MKLLNLDGKDSDSPIKLELKVIKEANSNKDLIFLQAIIFVEDHNDINAIRILQGQLISDHTHLT